MLAFALALLPGSVYAAENGGGNTEHSSSDTGLGMVLSRPDPDRELEGPLPGAGLPLASSVDVSAGSPPVGNQGMQNSCVGWATGYYFKTWQEKQEHPSWDVAEQEYQYSPSFIYNQINGGADSGSSIYDAMVLLEGTGDVDILEFPYSDQDYTSQPTSSQTQAAGQYRIESDWGYFFARSSWAVTNPYSPPNDISGVKTWLNSGKPLVMGIPIFSDFPHYNGNPPADYYESADMYGSGDLLGGHAVFITGYDDDANPAGSTPDTRGGFRLRNSWGTGWNDNGEVWISYKFVKQWVPEAWYMDDVDSSPFISSISPASGSSGSLVSIYGTNFGADRRSAQITFPGTGGGGSRGSGVATVKSWKNNSVEVYVPGDVGDGSVYLYDWDGEKSNGKDFTGSPSLATGWMLAEGATWPGFGEWVLVQNPGAEDSTVELTLVTPDGPVAGPTYTVPGQSRTTININELLPDSDVACVVTVTNGGPVYVERAMYVNTMDGKWGCHDSIGTTLAADTWYLAEGATWPGYDEWVLVMNPYFEPVDVDVTFQTPAGEVAGPSFTLEGASRESIHVNEYVPDRDVSTRVVSSTPGRGVVAERSMYVRTADGKLGCHNSMGTSEAAEGWGLAEGATWPGYEEWVLVQNPGTAPLNVHLFFLTPDYYSEGPVINLSGGSRTSVRVNDFEPNQDVSTLVLTEEEGQKVVVERALYVSTPDGKRGAHNAPGSVYGGRKWCMPEGATWPGFDEWVLVMNPDAELAAEVRLTFMTGSGPVAGPTATLPPASRKTFHVNDYVSGDVSTFVESDGFVVCERAMYVRTGDGKNGSHCSLGVIPTAPGSGLGGAGGLQRALTEILQQGL